MKLSELNQIFENYSIRSPPGTRRLEITRMCYNVLVHFSPMGFPEAERRRAACPGHLFAGPFSHRGKEFRILTEKEIT
jgi:hypothetical protein